MKGDGRFDVESISIRDKTLNSLGSSSGKRRCSFQVQNCARGPASMLVR
jgi:hypothetical protein